MARLAVGVVFGIVVGVVAGAALQIHAANEGDMGGGSDLTGTDGSETGEHVVPGVQAVSSPAPQPVDEPDPTVETPPAQQPPPGIWDRLAGCEASGDWHIANPPYYGGLQFDLASWRAAGGSGRPDQASRAEQIRVGQNWQRIRGWSAWPVCSRVVGLR